MGNLAIGMNKPCLDPVVVIGACGPARSNPLITRRLHETRLIRTAGLQRRFAAIPAPWQTKPRHRLRKHRSLKLSLSPRLASIGRYLDTSYFAEAGPGESGDLVKARSLRDRLSAR